MKVNGKYVTQFEPLDDVMDSIVGSTVELELERGGSAGFREAAGRRTCTRSRRAPISSSATPSCTRCPYQQARHFNMPVKGAYVANPGYVFGAGGVPRGAVISSFNSKDIASVDDLETALEGPVGDGERASVRFSTIDDPNGSQLRSVRIDRRWFPRSHCNARRQAGHLGLHGARGRLPAPKPEKGGITDFPTFKDPRLANIAPSLVQVSFDMPYSVSGITERNYHGTGLVLDAERGLVVVDRNTVPVSVGDVSITFAGTLQVPARVKLHASAAQPRAHRIRPEAHRHHAGEEREARAARHRAGRAGVGDRPRRRQRAEVAQHRDRGGRADPAAAVAHDALPGQQHRRHLRS